MKRLFTKKTYSFGLLLSPPDYKQTPEIFAGIVMCTFVLVAIVFCVYDIFVQKRNDKIIASAARANKVVSSMFPGTVRDQIMGDNSDGGKDLRSSRIFGTSSGTRPLADLFLETTILFADIAGAYASCVYS